MHTLHFHSDPGHGWLEAPMNLVRKLGIARSVTRFSYVSASGGTAYLEEDGDAGLLIEALKAKGEKYDVVFVDHEDDCFIRRLRRFK